MCLDEEMRTECRKSSAERRPVNDFFIGYDVIIESLECPDGVDDMMSAEGTQRQRRVKNRKHREAGTSR